MQPITAKQAQVLDNIERVRPLPYKLSVQSPVSRYELDGVECTLQITGLVVREHIEKTADGDFRRLRTERPRRRKYEPVGPRQSASPDAMKALKDLLDLPRFR